MKTEEQLIAVSARLFGAVQDASRKMMKKFVERDAKHGERSVLRMPIEEANIVSLWDHFEEELQEFREDPAGEYHDLMNMALLIGWYEESKK